VAGLLLLGAAGCGYKVPETTATARGDELFTLCSECHGKYAEGHPEYHAPAIAGLPQWYIENQLHKFKSGTRGAHPLDQTGMMMRPMTLSFRNEADLKTVAAYVSAMPPVKPAPTLKDTDPAHGKSLFAVCTACHGPEAAGNEAVKAPPLNRASDWYLVEQLRKFKHGIRGASPADLEGAQMRPMVATLADEQAIKDVVSHIVTLAR
jgi:cytochrome c oxidase subunit 2